jgi:hypothetical protein
MATLIKNHQEITIGAEEVEFRFRHESIESVDSPTQTVIIKTDSDNDGTIQFAAGDEEFTTQKAWGPDETVFITIRNGTKNLKAKGSAAGQKFVVMV